MKKLNDWWPQCMLFYIYTHSSDKIKTFHLDLIEKVPCYLYWKEFIQQTLCRLANTLAFQSVSLEHDSTFRILFVFFNLLPCIIRCWTNGFLLRVFGGLKERCCKAVFVCWEVFLMMISQLWLLMNSWRITIFWIYSSNIVRLKISIFMLLQPCR